MNKAMLIFIAGMFSGALSLWIGLRCQFIDYPGISFIHWPNLAAFALAIIALWLFGRITKNL